MRNSVSQHLSSLIFVYLKNIVFNRYEKVETSLLFRSLHKSLLVFDLNTPKIAFNRVEKKTKKDLKNASYYKVVEIHKSGIDIKNKRLHRFFIEVLFSLFSKFCSIFGTLRVFFNLV